MKAGRTLQEFATEIARQSLVKRDFIVPASRLRLDTVNGSQLHLGLDQKEYFGLRPTMHEQLSTRLDIPRAYYEKMRAHQPELLAVNVNTWLQTFSDRYLLRVLDNDARALLSDRYRPIDNVDLAEAILPRLNDLNVTIESCEITERRLYIKAVTSQVQADIVPGDVVQAGICISNSEVGLGALKIEPLIYRLICKNGAVINDMATRKSHIGRRHSSLDLNDHHTYAQYITDATRVAEDKAFWMKIHDVMNALLNGPTFQQIVAQWQLATTRAIVNPDVTTVVERTAKKFALAATEQSSVLEHLMAGRDLSAYGLMNAITRTAHDVESYDRSTDLERIGPQIIELPKTEWKALAEV